MLEKNIDLNGKRILVTGAAGFIGSNLCKELLRTYDDIHIYGIDNMNDYYDPKIKNDRLREIYELACDADESGSSDSDESRFDFVRGSIADKELVNSVFEEFKPEVVVNLAAQAGVRYSIENPDAYIESNIIGFYNILEACRHSYDAEGTDDNYAGVQHLVYASSSSVYGSNKKIPYSVEDKVDNPVSLYAATKKSDELLAHSYSKLYGIPSTGLRFFTVYGPAGRPDIRSAAVRRCSRIRCRCGRSGHGRGRSAVPPRSARRSGRRKRFAGSPVRAGACRKTARVSSGAGNVPRRAGSGRRSAPACAAVRNSPAAGFPFRPNRRSDALPDAVRWKP